MSGQEPVMPAQSRFPNKLPLSQREFEVLDLVKDGMTNRSAAVRLGISERTVREHVARILLKLGVSSRVEAAVVAAEWYLRSSMSNFGTTATQADRSNSVAGNPGGEISV
jgi:DNA-binding NarL/FixJ family response regulator